MRIADDIPEASVQAGFSRSGTRMAAPPGDLVLQVVFGRAFLLELERGNLQAATVFARAFLRYRAPLPSRGPRATSP